jgi:hypothetical protein
MNSDEFRKKIAGYAGWITFFLCMYLLFKS